MKEVNKLITFNKVLFKQINFYKLISEKINKAYRLYS